METVFLGLGTVHPFSNDDAFRIFAFLPSQELDYRTLTLTRRLSDPAALVREGAVLELRCAVLFKNYGDPGFACTRNHDLQISFQDMTVQQASVLAAHLLQKAPAYRRMLCTTETVCDITERCIELTAHTPVAALEPTCPIVTEFLVQLLKKDGFVSLRNNPGTGGPFSGAFEPRVLLTMCTDCGQEYDDVGVFYLPCRMDDCPGIAADPSRRSVCKCMAGTLLTPCVDPESDGAHVVMRYQDATLFYDQSLLPPNHAPALRNDFYIEDNCLHVARPVRRSSARLQAQQPPDAFPDPAAFARGAGPFLDFRPNVSGQPPSAAPGPAPIPPPVGQSHTSASPGPVPAVPRGMIAYNAAMRAAAAVPPPSPPPPFTPRSYGSNTENESPWEDERHPNIPRRPDSSESSDWE